MAGSVNKPKKPKSKRVPVRLRHKIEKASAAKQRKQRKFAKNNPEWRSKLKKDPGIPNLFPYKEKLLQQIEQDRARRKDDAQRRKDLARDARMGAEEAANDENDMDEDDDDFEASDDDDVMDDDADIGDESNPMAALIASARKAAEEYDKELQSENRRGERGEYGDGLEEQSEAADIEVHGGASSRKAYDKVFKQVVEQADVILYVLDARDPEGTRSRDVERSVLAAASGGKRLMLVLNKVDLVPSEVLRSWLTHLRRSFPTLPFRASGAVPSAQTFHHRGATVASTSGALFRALKAFAAGRSGGGRISVGVIGYPNVGKSSVINALLARLGSQRGATTACPAGAEAGVTTAIRTVKLDGRLTLLDSPGIVFPAAAAGPADPTEAHAHLVLLNAVPPRHIDDPVAAVALLLRRLAARPELMDRLTQVYDLPPLVPSAAGDVTSDFLVQVARRRGRLGRGGVPNIAAAAMTVVTDWRDGRIPGWTEAPVLAVADATSAATGAADGDLQSRKGKAATEDVTPDQKEIVSEWAKEFKIEGLWGDDDGEDENKESSKDVDMR